MDDIQANLTQRMDILTEKMAGSAPEITPTPTDMFQLAYSDYSKGKYDLAIVGFRAYMDKYPGTELATKSQYYLSDSYFNKKEYTTALIEFDKLISKYPHSEFILTAKYKEALCLIELGKITDAKKILENIVKYHPNTPEAEQSKNKLKSIITP
jgi:tol-pal system protein YbgF